MSFPEPPHGPSPISDTRPLEVECGCCGIALPRESAVEVPIYARPGGDRLVAVGFACAVCLEHSGRTCPELEPRTTGPAGRGCVGAPAVVSPQDKAG
jgi:hypothetical protein